MKNRSLASTLRLALRDVRVYWLFGLLSFGVCFCCYVTINKPPRTPQEKEFHAYFPRNGEFRPDTAIIAQQTSTGIREANPTFAEIKVSVEEFGRLAETSPYRPLVSTKLDNQTYHRQIINYWLWRDGMFYHAVSSSLPNIDWGSFWFSTKWTHKSGETWVATAVWDPFSLYVWGILGFIFGWVFFLVAFITIAIRLLRPQPSEA